MAITNTKNSQIVVDSDLICQDACAEEQGVNYFSRKLRIVLMLLAYSTDLGVISLFLPEEETPADFILGVPLLFLGIWWCFVDAEERGIQIGALLKWVLVLLFLVGFPIYIFRSRGVRGFATFGYLLLLIGAMAASMVTAVVVTMLLGMVFGFADL